MVPERSASLSGVVVGETRVSDADAEGPDLLYRGFSVASLLQLRYEDVVGLLWDEEISTGIGDSIREEAVNAMQLTPGAVAWLASVPPRMNPTDLFLAGAAQTHVWTPHGSNPLSDRRTATRLIGFAIAMIGYGHRARRGLPHLDPRPDWSIAENLFYMSFGREPRVEQIAALQVALILYAEQSFNASTYAARIAASAGTDLATAVIAAAAVLKGHRHGGANREVIAMLRDVASASSVKGWVDEATEQSRKIMGFGHRVFRNGDPRFQAMRAQLTPLSHDDGESMLRTGDRLVEEVSRRRGLRPNIDLAAAIAFHLLGFDTESYTALFAASRIAGWTAHIVEARSDNRLITPTARYVGARGRALVHLGPDHLVNDAIRPSPER